MGALARVRMRCSCSVLPSRPHLTFGTHEHGLEDPDVWQVSGLEFRM